MADANGNHVTRAELAVHIRRIDEHTASINERLANIESKLDAKPAQRWLAGRATKLIDNTLPSLLTGLVVVVGFLFAQ